MGDRVVITVTGKDKVGIVAGVAAAIAECGGNIVDISQTILEEFFAMIMIVSLSEAKGTFKEFEEKLSDVEVDLGVKIIAQHEEVFEYMHRI